MASSMPARLWASSQAPTRAAVLQVESVIRELTGLQRDGVTAARRELLPLMLVLENSPVLCAYGLVR